MDVGPGLPWAASVPRRRGQGLRSQCRGIGPILGLLAGLVACACTPGAISRPESSAPPKIRPAEEIDRSGEAPSGSAIGLRPDLSVRWIDPAVLLHESTRDLPGLGPIGSNGLVVLGTSGALLVDTAWGDEPTATLLDWVERETGRRVTDLVVTHSHDDRIGGIREARRRGVRVHELDRTARRAAIDGWPPPDATFAEQTVLQVDGERAWAFFPGAAHAPDNVVVWLPRHGILFGSCMVRAGDAIDVGNRADASLATWEASIDAIERRVPSPRIVVPGHGAPGGPELLSNTRRLVRKAVAETPAVPPVPPSGRGTSD